MTRQLTLTSLSLAVIAFLSAASTANAKQCKVDSDCADGFECNLDVWAGTGGSTGTSVGGGAAAGAAVGTACSGPDCPVSSPAADPATPKLAPVDGGAIAPPRDLVPPTPPSASDAGVATPVATIGTCRVKTLVCTSKADCPAILDCVKRTVVAPRPTCAPNTICDTPPDTTTISETGTCQAVCNVDSDCPAPLVCKLQGQTCSGGGSVGPDGKVTTTTESCTGGNKICGYAPVTCSTDAECNDANYQCAKVSEYKSCPVSSGGCSKPRGDAGSVCTPMPAEPPACTSVVVNNCMPKQFNCDAGQTCPTGWSCFDFSNFEGASLPGWSTPIPSKACLPDGLILATKGQASGFGLGTTYSGSNPTSNGGGTIDLGKGGSSSGDNGSNSGQGTPVRTGGDPSLPPSTPVPATDGEEHATPGDAGVEAAAAAPKVRGGGCALGGQGGSADLWLTLGLAGLVLRLVRRRK